MTPPAEGHGGTHLSPRPSHKHCPRTASHTACRGPRSRRRCRSGAYRSLRLSITDWGAAGSHTGRELVIGRRGSDRTTRVSARRWTQLCCTVLELAKVAFVACRSITYILVRPDLPGLSPGYLCAGRCSRSTRKTGGWGAVEPFVSGQPIDVHTGGSHERDRHASGA